MLKKILYLGCLFVVVVLHAHKSVLIFTYVYNRPDFIELHAKTFNAFLRESYEYIVFNDAPDAAMSNKIEQTCKRLNVRCLRVPPHVQHRQSPSYRHMDGIKHSLKVCGFDHDGIVMMIDADMFLIRPFSIKEYMGAYDFVGGYQYRSYDHKRDVLDEADFVRGFRFENDKRKVIYTSPCLVFMNMGRLPNKKTLNFDGDCVEGLPCDVGGHTYYYFKDNPSVAVRLYLAVSRDYLVTLSRPLAEYGYDQNSIDFILNNNREYAFQYHADANFLHFYAGGSNWPNYSVDVIREKTRLVNEYIDKQIACYDRIRT